MANSLGISTFLYDASEITQNFVSRLNIRHCLCSDSSFSNLLLKEGKETYDGIEWAQSQVGEIQYGKLIHPIRKTGHILSRIFIPVFGGLSITVKGHTYYFDGEQTEEGCRVALYIPLGLCSLDFELAVDIEGYEGQKIPLTFFYINLCPHMRVSQLPSNYPIYDIQDAIRNMGPFHQLRTKLDLDLDKILSPEKGSGLAEMVLFSTKGRFDKKPYLEYISSERVRVSSLGNYQLVMLYTTRKQELCEALTRGL